MRLLLSLLLAACALQQLSADQPPTAKIQSGDITLTVYLPDAKAGYYRGTRFDWSGLFTMQFGKHTVFGPWKSGHNPENHDDIVGPCLEFGTEHTLPLNYKDAQPGGRFVKIGVGECEKPDEERYQFWNAYKITNPGTWTTKISDDAVVFTHELKTDTRYAYKYTKELSIADNTVSLKQTLENTGDKTITTDCYNHNFFNVDGDTDTKNYTIDFGFKPKLTVQKERFEELVSLDEQQLRFWGKLDTGSAYAEFEGFDATDAKRHQFQLKHTKSGVCAEVTCDLPLWRFHFWSTTTAVCPEPFVHLSVEPGKSQSWMWKYTLRDQSK
jgi:hypothetical protein